MLRFEVKTTKHKDAQWRQNLPAARCELTKNEVKSDYGSPDGKIVVLIQ